MVNTNEILISSSLSSSSTSSLSSSSSSILSYITSSITTTITSLLSSISLSSNYLRSTRLLQVKYGEPIIEIIDEAKYRDPEPGEQIVEYVNTQIYPSIQQKKKATRSPIKAVVSSPSSPSSPSSSTILPVINTQQSYNKANITGHFLNMTKTGKDDDQSSLDDDEEFFQPVSLDDDAIPDTDAKSTKICRRIDDNNNHILKIDNEVNVAIVNKSKLAIEEIGFMDCFTLYNSCLDKNNVIVIQAKDEDEIPSHLGSLSTEWFSVQQCNASTPTKLMNREKVVSVPLSIRPMLQGEDRFANVPYDECSNGLIILSDYLENFAHTYYVASQLFSLFQRKVITSAVSLIPVSGLSLKLETFQKGIFSLLPIYRLIDWSLSVSDATVKRGTREFVRKYSSDSTLSKCFKKLEICRICSKDNLPGVLDSATKLGMLAQEQYGGGYPQDSGFQRWQSPNDSKTVKQSSDVQIEHTNSTNWRGLPKLVLTIVQKPNSLGKIMNTMDILNYCGKGVILNTTDINAADNIYVDSFTNKTGLIVLICRVHEVGKRLLDDLRIAATTDILLGLHGDGLINTLFIRPSGHLIEIRPCNVHRDVASKYEKMASYQSSYAWRFFWLIKYNNDFCSTSNR